ncbi:hypothetical protein A2U01_0115624, partial [Trifolium medium]|nr:hypothetical protein [Trifolium medium]
MVADAPEKPKSLVCARHASLLLAERAGRHFSPDFTKKLKITEMARYCLPLL